MGNLTPQAIVCELDKYIIGQKGAKRAVAIALCTRERRKKLPPELRQEITPKNILMIGPTGVGKTEIARRMARMINAPFVKVEATKFTEVGYVGRDVDSIISDLVETGVTKVYGEKLKEVENEAEKLVNKKLIGYLYQQLAPENKRQVAKGRLAIGTISAQRRGRKPAPLSRQLIAKLLQSHQLDDQIIEIEVDRGVRGQSVVSGFYHDEAEEFEDRSDIFMADLTDYGQTQQHRRVSVKEARRILTRLEAGKMLDFSQVLEEATEQVEENGVVFLDELDKLVGPRIEVGRDVSGEGVQRDLLPLLEGARVITRYGIVKTDHILFIAAGAFYHSRPSELIPELQGRFPLRVELSPLTLTDLERILVEPQDALTRQYQALLATEGVELIFTESGIKEIARLATLMNERSENTGARRLNTIMEKVLEELNFSAPEKAGNRITVDIDYVRQHIGNLIKDEDLSRYIL